MFRKKKPQESKPICVHDWYLIDTRIIDIYNGAGIDIERMYTVGCPKCDTRKELDEYRYDHFKRTFKIGKGER
jgi:hypothetical protein